MGVYNMVNQSGFFAIGDGGRLKPHHGPMVGSYKNEIEPGWRRKAREMVEQSKSAYPSPRESALERELWKQSTGGNRTDVNVSPKLAADYAAHQEQIIRENDLSRKLFEQVSGR